MSDTGDSKTSLYFTSLLHLLRKESSYIPPSLVKSSAAFTKVKRHCLGRTQDSTKKKAQKSVPRGACKKQAASALVPKGRTEQACDRPVASIAREERKAISQLQNSKSYCTRTMRLLQDRQLEMCRTHERKQMLIHAHSLYDRAPVLETKRFCGACARRPKSAMADVWLTMPRDLQGVLKRSCEDYSPPTAAHTRRKVVSAGARAIYSGSPVYGSRVEQSSSPSGRHLPSPTPSSTCPTPSISPMRSFDLSPIPNCSTTRSNARQSFRSV